MYRKGVAKKGYRGGTARRKPRNMWWCGSQGEKVLKGVFVRSDWSASILVKRNFGGDLVGEAGLEWVEVWMQVKITFERLGSGED